VGQKTTPQNFVKTKSWPKTAKFSITLATTFVNISTEICGLGQTLLAFVRAVMS